MEKEFSKEDRAMIKMISQAFGKSEKEVEESYVPLSDYGLGMLDFAIPEKKETKKEKIEKDIKFLQKMLLTANFYQTGEGFKADYAIEIPEYRENMQDDIMKLIQQYLQCK